PPCTGVLQSMGLKGFERRLERLVEGAFSRAFRSGLRPVQLGRRLVREMDDKRTLGVSGDQVAPNQFLVVISESDFERLTGVKTSLERDLAETARDHARSENYKFLGPVAVEVLGEINVREGDFDITATFAEAEGVQGAGSLVIDSEVRVPLEAPVVILGRLAECSVQLSDPNVSRQHAELNNVEGGWVITDLGSMNGTRVNGYPIGEQRLADGDIITIGQHTIRFEIS
ncbi:MAG: FhaA domain-containing protein, partial [Acidimicrobiales bacterium]